MKSLRSSRLVAVAVALSSPACAGLVGADFDHALTADGGSDAASDATRDTRDDAGDGGDRSGDRSDVASDAGDGASGDAGADSACPGRVGPAGVWIESDAGTYCVDSTEVTRAQYALFLSDAGSVAPVPTPPASCAWNTDYTPANWNPGAVDDRPVSGVSWCDAYAYCAWAGKHLCGKLGGGGSGQGGGGAADTQWAVACSHQGELTYPYGQTYDPSRCNGLDADAGAVAPVRSFSGCEGGYAGLFDMSGNVGEWQDFCDDGAPPGRADACAIRGGSFYNPSSTLACGGTLVSSRDSTHSDVGFRCCSP